MSYAELLACTNFSFQRGASHPFEMVKRAKQLGYAALAVSDECTLAGIVRADDAARDEKLKLIVGSQFRFAEGDRIVLLTPTQAAYTQLCELITRMRLHSAKGSYTIDRAHFEAGIDACIALWVPAPELSEATARWFSQLPMAERYLIFTHRLAQDSERRLERLQRLGSVLGLPLVAAGDAHYHVRDRRPLHDVLTAIRLKTTVDRIGHEALPNGECHLRPLSTLRRLYPPELLARTLEIAARCSFELRNLHYEYPEELVPAGMTAIEHLRAKTAQGARRRWPDAVPQKVQALLEKELRLIEELKYEHFFLTVAEMVDFARDPQRNILCQGRGSAANSAVCYALGITEVDPEHSETLFERFISKERHEPPDIDVDFEHQRREEVIQHVYEKYGRQRAALAATVITYRRRMAVRDVGKALGLAPNVVDALSKSLQWFSDGGELCDSLRALGFDPAARNIALLVRLANMLLGFPRHLSQHVGGFVISQHPLSTLVPVENAAMPDRSIIQWDKTDLESLGLLKVDCLALGMLSAIRRTLELKSAFDGKPFGISDIPDEDPETYQMLQRAESVGVFQVESRAQMTMLPRLKPKEYYDLVVQIAIIRPGPIQGGMVHPYLRRRSGAEPVTYPSPELAQVLGRTYGVPLFQEQVMSIVMVAAGFTAGEADMVRRSMAAWQRRGGLEQFHDKLISGMLGKGYTREFAEQIYQQILGFGSYGFPESHAASFALLAYKSSWLRCHHHPAFVAGLLNSWPIGFYSPAQLVNDARRHGVVFRPVDVQHSHWDCTLEADARGHPEVRLGMNRVSGLNEAQGRAIESSRLRDGPFRHVDELASRASLNRRALQQLARAGALTALAGHRRSAQWSALGIEKLPGALRGKSAQETPLELPAPSEGETLVLDYRSLGLTLGRHPLALLRAKLARRHARRAADLAELGTGRRIRIAGIVTHRQHPETASGVIFMSIEDETGIANLIVWPSVHARFRQAVYTARMVFVEGELQNEQNVIHVVVESIRDCSSWLGRLQTSSRDFH